VGLQYVVCSPAAVVTFVSTGVFNFTLVHISVTLGACGIFGAAGGAGAPGGFGAPGAAGSFASGTFKLGIFAFGSDGLGGGGTAGMVKRLPSTSCPSIIDLPRSCTCTFGGWTAAAAPGGEPGGDGIADPGGVIGITLASFLT